MEDTTQIDSSRKNNKAQSTGQVVAKATGLMILTVSLSRLLGFVRESLLMAYFGQGALTDVYKQSFLIPDTLYFLIAGGALSSAFIPVFTRFLTEGNEEDAWKTFSIVACVASAVALAFIILGEIFALPVSRLISGDFLPVQVKHVAYLTRIVLPAQLFFFIGGLMMGTHYSRHHYWAPALGPLVYTIGIIAGGLLTAHIYASDIRYLHSPEVIKAIEIYFNSENPQQIAQVKDTVETAMALGTRAVSGYSWGALIGAFIGNFCIQLYMMRRLGSKFFLSFDMKHEGARKVFALMLPVILGLSLPQVDVQLNKYFATMLNEGSVTALDNANRLMQVPYGTLGTAFAIALFPTLSALAAQNLWGDFRYQISNGLRRMLFMAIPASVLLMVLAIPSARLVFEHGSLMTPHHTFITAVTLILFSAGIFGWCMQAVLARGFYALHDTKTVVITGTIMTVLFVGMSVGFIRFFPDPKTVDLAPAGLALITTIAAVLHALVLMWMLSKRIGGINGREVLTASVKILLACAVMALVTLPIYYKIEHSAFFSNMLRGSNSGEIQKMILTAGEICVVGIAGVLVYAGMAKVLGLEELENAVSMFRGKFRRRAAK